MLKNGKILAINFKLLGDVTLCTPSLKAIHESFPNSELHVLVSEPAIAILTHIPWIKRVWGLPKKANIRKSLPLIRALRREGFDRSVDFIGNDRGALISLCVGAKRRLGILPVPAAWWRRWCYTETIEELDTTRHDSIRYAYALPMWDISFPQNLSLEVVPNPEMKQAAQKTPVSGAILCHLTTSQPKKEWPLPYWIELYQMLQEKEGIRLVFSSGSTPKERTLLDTLHLALPQATCLPAFDTLESFIATVACARCFISPDTGPLHMAAGLGIPTIGLFGPSAASKWAPLGPNHRSLQGGPCPCSGHWATCKHRTPCISYISPQAVVDTLEELLCQLKTSQDCPSQQPL